MFFSPTRDHRSWDLIMGMQLMLCLFTFFTIVGAHSVFGYHAAPLSFYKFRNARKRYHLHPPNYNKQGFTPSPFYSPTPAPSPAISPSISSINANTLPPASTRTLPPPPPNQDCTSLTCTQPLTYTPAGVPCGCVRPIQVGLSIGVALYTFFPLVSELAKEISASLSLNQSQVRIMGADAATDLQKTVVLVNLVPLKDKFDPITAFSIYRNFWKKQVFVDTSLFGDHKTVYVRYPGLPPPPPSMSSSTTTADIPADAVNGNNGMTVKPIGVDVPKRIKDGTRNGMLIVVVLSSVTAFAICVGVIWVLLLKCGCSICPPKENPHVLISSHGKVSGARRSLTYRSRASSESMSFSSSLLTYTGTAKIFSLDDIERVTDNFETSRIIGEGGFGLVYSGVLEDGRKVAVKILKRDDQQGSREFLAEVEMLSRLHHRNLVKLIGICTEEHCHCLVYELVPNGSVESHLHGVDKESSPLDWCARMKIALGAARGLAYLHEDSSPRVIHRDFKSSNILLENDFTPKVSDFGLARTALEEGGNKHISTHVMGTFGYLAPEYAMTGHLLVKSDVYSYGVVLLELLTGRKPVDLSQPPGQENLVAWAHPLLSTKEGLVLIVDPTLKSNILFDSVVKVAAIASMCVQPEVSHRPFMGEVVQALKLVCNEFDEIKEPLISRSCSEIVGSSSLTRNPLFGYDPFFDTIEIIEEPETSSPRRQINSAPLKTGKRMMLWQYLKGMSRDSKSENMGLRLK